MTQITIKCLCDKKELLKGELKGEGSLICPKCYREYKRIYNQKTHNYEFK
jgi:hypothetical protein